MGSTIEVVLTIIGLSFWILFPIGMFLSVSRVDKNTDQVVRLHQEEHREESEEALPSQSPFRPVPFDWHHPIIFFRQWPQHE
jgi:hypothetical protein